MEDESAATATGEADGLPIVVTAAGRTVQAWDPSTGRAIGKPMNTGVENVWTLATIVLGGRPHAVAGMSTQRGFGRLALWDLTTCEAVGGPAGAALGRRGSGGPGRWVGGCRARMRGLRTEGFRSPSRLRPRGLGRRDSRACADW